MRENVGQCDRGVVDIAATHVEQPGDRIERAYNSSVIAFLLEPVGHLGALVGTRPAGVRIVMRHRRCQRGLGPVGPDRVDRVAVDRDQFDSFLGEVLLRLFGPADAVEPCVIADLRSLGRIFGDPLRGRGGRHVLVIVQRPADLLANLHGVAPVGEHRRAVAQHCGASRTAAETGQPFEPLRIGADIFAHMLVGDRDDEAIQAAAGQFLAQSVEAGFVGLHQHGRNSFHRVRSQLRRLGACGPSHGRIITPLS